MANYIFLTIEYCSRLGKFISVSALLSLMLSPQSAADGTAAFVIPSLSKYELSKCPSPKADSSRVKQIQFNPGSIELLPHVPAGPGKDARREDLGGAHFQSPQALIQLERLKLVLEELRRRDSSNASEVAKVGLFALASVHGFWDATCLPDDALTKGVWTSCVHGLGDDDHYMFLLWHRAYLMALEASAQSVLNHLPEQRKVVDWMDFRIPYWDWLTHTSVPDSFRIPAPMPLAANPLYEPARGNEASGGDSVIDPSKSDPFLDPNSEDLDRFSNLFETGWHSQIHRHVGGTNVSTGSGCPLMGHQNTAGFDPLFWVHHANVDRVFENWLKHNRAALKVGDLNATWKKNDYRFVVDIDGKATIWKPLLSELGICAGTGRCGDAKRVGPDVWRSLELPKPVGEPPELPDFETAAVVKANTIEFQPGCSAVGRKARTIAWAGAQSLEDTTHMISVGELGTKMAVRFSCFQRDELSKLARKSPAQFKSLYVALDVPRTVSSHPEVVAYKVYWNGARCPTPRVCTYKNQFIGAVNLFGAEAAIGGFGAKAVGGAQNFRFDLDQVSQILEVAASEGQVWISVVPEISKTERALLSSSETFLKMDSIRLVVEVDEKIAGADPAWCYCGYGGGESSACVVYEKMPPACTRH